MIYLIGGAPRVGKSTLCQRLAKRMAIGWTSTDILFDMLTFDGKAGKKPEWNADPVAIRTTAEWSFPYLQRFVWGVSSHANDYIVEGVWILPAQAKQLANEYAVRVVFLGSTDMSLEKLDRYPGHSKGYARLPFEMRMQIAGDVPSWSRFIRNEAERHDYVYVDTAIDFEARIDEAERALVPAEFQK